DPGPADESGLLRGEAWLRASLGAVLGAGLLAVRDARRVERGPDHLVAEARQVLDAPAADQDDGVLLEVVPLPGDVGADLHAVRQAHAGDLAQGGVRLLRRRRVDARADAPLLRRAAQRGRLHLRLRRLAALADELIDSRHQFSGILLERVGTSLDTNKAGGATTHANPGLDGSEAR